MDKIGVCAIFKDEAPYLLEWLAFHRMIGVDQFVLYDNGSTDGGAELIHASAFAGNVAVIDWPERPGQLSAYSHFRIHHAPRFAWAAFIYETYAQILLQWLVFGPSGHDRRPEGLVIENYTTRLPDAAEVSRHSKSIVRTDMPTECHDVMVVNHYFTKSVEDWEFKSQRGRGDSLDPYGDRVFSDVQNHAIVQDTSALRFVPRLRALLVA
jgi:glycosyl transferase family 2